MSVLANFFVISEAKFEEYRHKANLLPYKHVPMQTGVIAAVEGRGPAARKSQEHYAKLWDFLRENSKQPYEYKWSGNTLLELIGWLKETKGVDLTEIQFESDAGSWLVFNQTLQKKYLEQLNPANFNTDDIIHSSELLLNQKQQMILKETSSKLTNEQMAWLSEMARKCNEVPPVESKTAGTEQSN